MQAIWKNLNAELIGSLPLAERHRFLESLNADTRALLFRNWYFWAREEQCPPSGSWNTWLYLGGRGAGKTRAGAEWIFDGVANKQMRRIALIGATHNDARAVMVEGVSGLMSVSKGAIYEPSNFRVRWANGAVATVLSAEEPDGIRGHQFDAAWGDVQAKLNKHASGDTASLLYQTNYSGRAELGLTGDDNLHCKVSPDGAAWTAALTIDKTSGAVGLAAGSASAPSLSFGDAATGWYGVSTGNLGVTAAGAQVWTLSATGLIQSIPGGGLSQINVLGEGTTQQNFSRYSNDANAPVLSFVHGRGTIASRAVVQTNDALGALQFSGYNGSSTTVAARMRGLLIETGTVGAAAMGGQLRFEICPIGSGALSEIMRLDAGSGLSLFGANPVIDQNRAHRLRSTTIAGAVSPSVAGNLFYHSDAQGGAGEVAVDTGTSYRHAGQAAVKRLTTDTDGNYTPRADGRIVRDSATLSTDRKFTLLTTGATDGHKVEFSRRGSSGGFNRKIYQSDGTTLIANLADNTAAAFVFDASVSLWFQI